MTYLKKLRGLYLVLVHLLICVGKLDQSLNQNIQANKIISNSWIYMPNLHH